MNVLVVEDEVIARTTIAHTLREAGYQVTTASNGQEALSLFQKQTHQLIVSDWRMPVMDGLDLCHAIRTAGLRRYVYFIMVTSRDRSSDIMAGFTSGVDDYLVKPFNPAELLLRVNVGRRITQLETSQMTIFALAKLAESRDPETGAHLERVRGYSRVIARKLQENPVFGELVDDDFVSLLYDTSPLHDIGKVAIPDAILLKPGKLTASEFEIMKTHTLRGAETLEAALQEFPNARFLKMARDIALSHHEKYDGSGYPFRLVGQNIPLSARIVALADAYDAITSKRIYKEAAGHTSACAIIAAERDRHFDPVIVDAFLEAEAEMQAIHLQNGTTHELPGVSSIKPPNLISTPELLVARTCPGSLPDTAIL